MAKASRTKTTERELAKDSASDLRKRERRTAGALLLAERRAVHRIASALSLPTNAVVASAARGGKAAAISHIDAASHSLPHDLRTPLLASIADARATGRATVERELRERLPATPHIPSPVDSVAANVGAASISSAWSQAAIDATAEAESEAELVRLLAELLGSLEGRVGRVAATEVARAFNNEREQALVMLGSTGGHFDDLFRIESKPGLYKIWSAVLDGKTCNRCFAIDGEVRELDEKFSAGAPPLHPNCRCVVEHIVVPKPERLEDISIDYDLFKQELRDVIREGRAESDRHALRFAAESLGSKRSPKALTGRFANEPYVRR